jgi:hypothetical protein
MRAELSAGYARQIRRRRQWRPRLPRRARVLACAAVLCILVVLVYLQYQGLMNERPVRKALFDLTPAKVRAWAKVDPRAGPLASLLTSLTPQQVRMLGRSSDHRLSYTHLSPEQRSLYRRVLDVQHAQMWAGNPAGESTMWKSPDATPTYLYVCPRREGFSTLVRVGYRIPSASSPLNTEAGGWIHLPQ